MSMGAYADSRHKKRRIRLTKITNAPDEVEKLPSTCRDDIAHRAAWLALIFDEMKKAGVADAEGILKKAVKRCGKVHGANFKSKCKNPDNCEDFQEVFINPLGVSIFRMSDYSADKDNFKVKFSYCPLVASWQKFGFDDETCATLCDIAMEGDRGIAETMGLKLTLNETIAAGNSGCAIHFHK
jgi:hypothetical protein